MTELNSAELDFGITCIDAGYIRPGIACFYLLQQGEEYALIETGTSRSFPGLQKILARRGIAAEQVRYVIPTHVHLDHAGGVGAMMAAFPEAQLLIHPRGARHMIEPQKLVASAQAVYGEQRFAELYGEITPVPAHRVTQLADGDKVSLAGRPLQVRHTRGHAEHHFCVWDETSRGWFSGDMFGISYRAFRFPGGNYVLPATTPTQFDPDAYLQALELLTSYDPRRIYMTHFGELEYDSETAALLARQISAYRDIAAQCSSDGKDIDQAALECALTDYSLAIIGELGSVTSESELREQLAFDMDLNAQGLSVWWKRYIA